MKLSSVNSVKVVNNRSINNENNRNKQTNNQPNFKGNVVNGLINFWQFIDNGGRALQFTAEDMTGTNFPRSISGARAGKKLNGKYNKKGFIQEFVREFLTGPTMCVVPVLVLNAAIKLSGKTANTHIENIKNLSYLLENTTPGANLEDSFIKEAVSDMLSQSIGKDKNVSETEIKSIVDGIEEYKKATKKGKKTALSSLQTTFENIIKKNKDSYNNVNFLNAKYSLGGGKTGSTNFKNYIEYMVSYIQDYNKQFNSNVSSDNIKTFKNSWIGKRLFTIAGMAFITGALMCQIPKIYTKLSGKVNPSASAVYDEAKKRNEGGK